MMSKIFLTYMSVVSWHKQSVIFQQSLDEKKKTPLTLCILMDSAIQFDKVMMAYCIHIIGAQWLSGRVLD